MARLGVNVDHVARLRQARDGEIPSPIWAAVVAEQAGCDGIVCHLREDRRHIQDQDLSAFKQVLRTPLNLEMAIHPEIVRIACRIKPAQATLVPERRQELTTEGGLDLRRGRARFSRAIRQLKEAGIRVSIFIDPDPAQVERAAELGVPMVELHTGRYARARTRPHIEEALSGLGEAARCRVPSALESWGLSLKGRRQAAAMSRRWEMITPPSCRGVPVMKMVWRSSLEIAASRATPLSA